jgi:hypothetical protein
LQEWKKKSSDLLIFKIMIETIFNVFHHHHLTFSNSCFDCQRGSFLELPGLFFEAFFVQKILTCSGIANPCLGRFTINGHSSGDERRGFSDHFISDFQLGAISFFHHPGAIFVHKAQIIPQVL